mgnify:CR=1 FL=1
MASYKGKDQWGYFYNMTGYEAKGFCFWCGKQTGHKRFCNEECKENYHRHFVWENARNWCLARAGNKCEKCGIKPLQSPKMQGVTRAEVAELMSEYPKMLFSRAYASINKEYQNKYDYETKKYRYSQLEAHHIDPLNGDKRHINIKNRPENLICLCNKCHSHINSKVKEQVVDKQMSLL